MSTNAREYGLGLERRLLGILLVNPELFPEVTAKLIDDSFADQRHQLVYDTARDLASANRGEISASDVIQYLERGGRIDEAGGADYVLELLNDPGALDPRALQPLAEQVEEMAVRRRAAATLQNALKDLGDLSLNHDTVLVSAQTELRSILENARTEELELISNAVDELLENLESGIEPGVPTGVPSLDYAIQGGIKPSQLVTLAGATGMGKTSLGTQVALNAAGWASSDKTRGDVLFFSFEMDKSELTLRMVMQLEHIPDGYHPPDGFSRRDRELVRQTLARIRTLPIRIEDRAERTVEAVRAATERYINSHGNPALVVVDHIGLMKSPKRVSNRAEEMTHITSSLKSMAMQLQVPVLALAQLSREVEKRDDHQPRLSDLKESSSVEQDSNVVLLVYRPSYYEKDYTLRNELDSAGSDAWVYVAKNRSGPPTEVKVQWLGPRYLFIVPPPDAEIAMAPTTATGTAPARPALDPIAGSSADEAPLPDLDGDDALFT